MAKIAVHAMHASVSKFHHTIYTQVPIIAPIREKKAELLEHQPMKTNYNNAFLSGLMENPELVRNVAIVGHLHHGKTLVSL